MSLERAIAALEIATPIAETIPVLGTTLKGAVEATGKILKYAKEVKSNKEQTKELAQDAALWCNTLINTLNDVKREGADIRRFEEQVKSIFRALQLIRDWTERKAQQRMLQRAWNKSLDSEKLSEMRKGLHDAFERFILTSHIKIQQDLTDVLSMNREQITIADSDTLKSLQPVYAARYDSLESPSGCLQGTRISVIKSMLDWAVYSSSGFFIYRLGGLAGTGKSTIAKTFCENVIALDKFWVVTFFASKSSVDRRDPFRALYTFACELAYENMAARKKILAAIRAHPDIKQRPMKEQVQSLLAEPMRAAQSYGDARPLLIVIDALDECQKINGVEGGSLIRDLADALQGLSAKLVVTSRLEESLRRMFDSLPAKVTYLLHEVESLEVAADVDRILRTGFETIAADHAIATRPWPSHNDMSELTERTKHLIIFATTALKYIGDSRFSAPEKRLRQILDENMPFKKQSAFAQIDSLYLNVLMAAAQDDETNLVDDELCARLRVLTGAVILLQLPLDIAALAQLLDVPVRELDRDIRALAAVLLVSSTGINLEDHSSCSVQIFHPSFRDFLLDRCNNAQFSVHAPTQHEELATHCLNHLNHHLAYDICRIRDPSLSNDDVDNPPLSTRLHSHVSSALRYACTFWFIHIISSHPVQPTSALLCALREFVRYHLLHWIELLSLIRKLKLKGVARPLLKVIKWCQSHDQTDIAALLTDARQLLTDYDVVLSSHALQTYSCTLATIPQCGLLDMYHGLNVRYPTLITTRRVEWDTRSLVMQGHSQAVRIVVFSPNNLHVASASNNGSVKLWDIATGHEVVSLGNFTVHNDRIEVISFSQDGLQLFSGSTSGCVQVWDIYSGACIREFEATNGSQCLLVFSDSSMNMAASDLTDGNIYMWDVKEAQRIAIISEDRDDTDSQLWPLALSPDGTKLAYWLELGSGAINIWDRNMNKQAINLEECDSRIMSVAFSPNGTRLAASMFYDRCVWVFDVFSGERIAVLEGHDDNVFASVFSPDGTHVASASSDQTIRVWEMQDAKEILKFEGHSDKVLAVAFSRDGALIGSGGADCNIRLWDIQNVTNSISQNMHSERISCAVFSPVGDRVASGSYDRSIRIWDVHNGSNIARLSAHTDRVTSLSFSQDGTQLVSSARDYEIIVWDLGRMEQVTCIDTRELGTVTSLAFSPDGKHIASGFEEFSEAIVVLWDTRTGEPLFQCGKGKENELYAREDKITSVAFSPDGALVASTWYQKLQLWDVNTGKGVAHINITRDYKNGIIYMPRVAFSQDGQYVIVEFEEDYDKINSWAVAEILGPLPHAENRSWRHPNVGRLHFSINTGWITWRTWDICLELCWIPAQLRTDHSLLAYVTKRNWVVIGAITGQVTILDMSPILDLLSDLGHQILFEDDVISGQRDAQS